MAAEALNGPNFERLEHGGEGEFRGVVPLLIAPDGGLREDSGTLLLAVDVIGPCISVDELRNVVDRVGEMLTGPSSSGKGLIIENRDSGSSLTVDRQIARVTVPGRGRYVTPTHLLFAMLYEWAEYPQKEQ